MVFALCRWFHTNHLLRGMSSYLTDSANRLYVGWDQKRRLGVLFTVIYAGHKLKLVPPEVHAKGGHPSLVPSIFYVTLTLESDCRSEYKQMMLILIFKQHTVIRQIEATLTAVTDWYTSNVNVLPTSECGWICLSSCNDNYAVTKQAVREFAVGILHYRVLMDWSF
jgi:hypothetical protein